jgi:DNA-directed RNA polymerase specialized sigma24 family protein
MSDSNRSGLRNLLATRYAYLVRRLERVTGSKDGAADALHETWLRLENANVSTQVTNADAYILGMANNVAIDQHRRERRHLHDDDVETLLEMPDELADPERIVAARDPAGRPCGRPAEPRDRRAIRHFAAARGKRAECGNEVLPAAHAGRRRSVLGHARRPA